MSLSDDITAIDRYIKAQPLRTQAARKAYDEWTTWYNQSPWWYSQEDYDHARNLRNLFNIANATTAQEAASAKQVIATGMTAEEMAGGTRRTLADGMYAEPLVSESTRLMLGLGLLAVGLGYVATKAIEIGLMASPAGVLKKLS